MSHTTWLSRFGAITVSPRNGIRPDITPEYAPTTYAREVPRPGMNRQQAIALVLVLLMVVSPIAYAAVSIL